MHFFKTYLKLWQLLNRKEQLTFFSLVVLFFILGLLEILGISVILAYLSTLSNTSTGLRSQLLLKFFKYFFDNSSNNLVWQGAIFLMVFFLIKNIFGLFVEKLHLNFLKHLNNKIEFFIIQGYDKIPYKNFVSMGSINIRVNLTNASKIINTVFNSLLSIATDLIKSLAIIFVLLFISFSLTIIGLMSFGLVSLLTLIYTKNTISSLIKSRSSIYNNAIVLVNDFVDGLIELRLSQNNQKLIKNYLEHKNSVLELNQSKTFLNKLPKSINEISFAITLILAVIYFNFNRYDMMTLLPILFIFTFAGFKLNSFLANIAKNFQTLYASKQDTTKTLEVLEKLMPSLFDRQEQVNKNSTNSSYLKQFHGDICLDNVSFSYGPRLRIKNLSMTIKQGSFTAFCGHSGGGKTTLLLLIMGFLTPKSGHIKAGGKNIANDILSWQSMIGYVSQTPYISNRTLKENIAFGLNPDEIDENQIYKSLRLAGLESLLDKLSLGINTKLKHSGINLSGGELQRISIARALYRNPKVLIFDEATASLDKENENFIKETIEQLRVDKTIIFVTHKLSSVDKADIIYVIEDGLIVESGNYQELSDNNSKYL